ncbi:hypothetical protein R0J90_15095, partial [Micrococcus sp. SIMBA_144]
VASYSYSTLFTVEGDWGETLKDKIEQGDIRSLISPEFEYVYLSDSVEGSRPTYIEKDSIHILKFALKLTGFLPRERDNKRVIIYPILCLLIPAEN